jgi:hypothetical protein
VIFGPLMNQTALRQLAIDFLHDVSEVAIGVITNLYQIIRYIDRKEDLLFCLVNPMEKYSKWRIRLRVSEQLRYCSEDYDHGVLKESAKQLLRDDAAIVRNDALLSFVCLVNADDIEYLVAMTASNFWIDRMVTAAMIGYFTDEIIEATAGLVCSLAVDPVPNVRIAATRSLKALIARDLPGVDRLCESYERLKDDSDVDVRQLARD